MPDMANVEKFSCWLESLSEFDYVINCAGIVRDNILGKIKTSDIIETVNINLVSNVLILNKFLPIMLNRQFGRLIIMGSIVGESGNVGQAVYSSSKSALVGLVRTAVREINLYTLRSKAANVTVNLLEPGFVKSNMTDRVPEKILDRILSRKPNQSLLEASAIADTVIDLLRAESPFNGAVLRANGGLSL